MLHSVFITVLGLLVMASVASAQDQGYKPNWKSLDSRPVAQWFDEAKFGIFIHWGVYSVPAWAPKGKYAEWYWYHLMQGKGPTLNFHKRTYGKDFKYQDFAGSFKAEMFEPEKWADVFVRSGAKYVVLTSKHHDGFCLWPNAQSANWNSVDIGPHRDLVGDLTEAVRAAGLKMGLYYSLYEWYHPYYLADVERYIDEHMLPQMKDVVERYKPSILWTDGEWEHPSKVWRSVEFLTWLFNESSCRDVVINDRWGKECRSKHGGFYTTEYGRVHAGQELGKGHKWEECRGIGRSFGYNRNEDVSDYSTSKELIHLLIEMVSRGGNLLLDIGPTADGRIPVIMQQRLLDIGQWLKINGEAIYGTQQWRKQSEGEFVRYTAKDGVVYAICLSWPGQELVLNAPKVDSNTKVTMLGLKRSLKWGGDGGKLTIEVPSLSPDKLPSQHAYVFKLTGVK